MLLLEKLVVVASTGMIKESGVRGIVRVLLRVEGPSDTDGKVVVVVAVLRLLHAVMPSYEEEEDIVVVGDKEGRKKEEQGVWGLMLNVRVVVELDSGAESGVEESGPGRFDDDGGEGLGLLESEGISISPPKRSGRDGNSFEKKSSNKEISLWCVPLVSESMVGEREGAEGD